METYEKEWSFILGIQYTTPYCVRYTYNKLKRSCIFYLFILKSHQQRRWRFYKNIFYLVYQQWDQQSKIQPDKKNMLNLLINIDRWEGLQIKVEFLMYFFQTHKHISHTG